VEGTKIKKYDDFCVVVYTLICGQQNINMGKLAQFHSSNSATVHYAS